LPAGFILLTLECVNDAQKLAHEIQSPLTSLEVQLRTLIEESPASTAIENCLHEVEALKSLVTRFLELDMPVAPHDPWPLSAVLARIERRFRPIAETRRIRLEIDPTEAEAPGDPLATERILANLVDNAIKFSQEGGLVRVLVQHEDSHLHIKVSDEGRGIPSEARERIFEPFFRLDREAPGAGLGLAISKRLAEAQNGTLQLDGTGKVGACFLLTLKSP